MSSLVLGINAFYAKSRNYNKKSLSPAHNVMGRFQRLKALAHRHLCSYMDILKGKHDRLYVASEHYTKTLASELQRVKSQGHMGLDEEVVQRIVFEVLGALAYLNDNEVVHRNLNLENILFDPQGGIKLANWGLFYMTGAGSLVSFPIGQAPRMAPETIADGVVFTEDQHSPKSETWSVGVLIYELVTGQLPFQPSSDAIDPTFNVLLQILSFVGHEVHIQLEEKKLKELEATDVELLKQKEVGVGVKKRGPEALANSSPSDSPSSSPTPFARTPSPNQAKYEAPMTAAERNQQHAALSARRKKALDDWLLRGSHASVWSNVSPELRDILGLCLTADPEARVTPAELFDHPYFSVLHEELASKRLWVPKPFLKTSLLDRPEGDKWRKQFLDSKLKIDPLQTQQLIDSVSERKEVPTSRPSAAAAKVPQRSMVRSASGATAKPIEKPVEEPHQELSLKELFHFWKITANADVESLLPELKISPPIFRLPLLMRTQTGTGSDVRAMLQQYGQKDESRSYSNYIVYVSLQKLKDFIAKHKKEQLPAIKGETDERTLDEKEHDIEYQMRRLRVFRDLLQHYPDSKPQLFKESKVDIPPVLRAPIWAALLNLPPLEECKKIYDSIDKESEGPVDRQIELDIPRCHQYHELLSSPEGHRKFKRILKAWVAYNPDLSYWQGIDSLLAPFLVLNFDNEARAFMCLQLMIEKYSKNIFRKDKTVFLQEYLTIFAQLLSYHDPQLSMHLNNLGFKTDLYAIAWFISLFSHDFAIDQIMRLWDRLLPSSSQMPFYFCYAMMKQLRAVILPLDFNSCILLFSALPSVDLEEFVSDAKETAYNTPISVTMPNYIHEEESQKANERWWEHRITLEDLSLELFPRVSVMDLISSKFQWAVLDIRSPAEFALLQYPGSINVDPDVAGALVGRLQAPPLKGKHFVVLSSGNGSEGRKFANALVENLVPRVSLLNGGIDALVADAGDLLTRKEAPLE